MLILQQVMENLSKSSNIILFLLAKTVLIKTSSLYDLTNHSPCAAALRTRARGPGGDGVKVVLSRLASLGGAVGWVDLLAASKNAYNFRL